MRRLGYALLLFLASVVLPLPAHAGVVWCKSDPVFSFNGTIVDVAVDIPLEYVPYVSGPIEYKIHLPASVERQIIVSDLGYNGHGVTVEFIDRGGGTNDNQFHITVRATVPIDTARHPLGGPAPTALTVFPLNAQPQAVEGTSVHTAMSLWITGQ